MTAPTIIQSLDAITALGVYQFGPYLLTPTLQGSYDDNMDFEVRVPRWEGGTALAGEMAYRTSRLASVEPRWIFRRLGENGVMEGWANFGPRRELAAVAELFPIRKPPEEAPPIYIRDSPRLRYMRGFDRAYNPRSGRVR